jgi:hypothetical protein
MQRNKSYRRMGGYRPGRNADRFGEYVPYYNEDRPRISLDRDAPVARAVQPPSVGRLVALPRVGGLHDRYSRAARICRTRFFATTGKDVVVIDFAQASAAYEADMKTNGGFSIDCNTGGRTRVGAAANQPVDMAVPESASVQGQSRAVCHRSARWVSELLQDPVTTWVGAR